MHRFLPAILIIFIISAPAAADTVFLKNKNEINGKIIQEDKDTIVLAIAGMGKVKIYKREIKRIEKNDKDGRSHVTSAETMKKLQRELDRLRAIEEAEERKAEEERKKEEEKKEEKETKNGDGKKAGPEPLPEPTEEEAKEIATLVYQLGHRKSGFRNAARSRIVKFGAKALKALFLALANGNEFQRQNAAAAIGMIKDKRGVEPLVKALEDGSKWVRKEANAALVAITGEDKGFDYEAEGSGRAAALSKWKAYAEKLAESYKKPAEGGK